MWREMPESEKAIWEAKTKAAKEKYNIEYKEWLEGGGAEALKQVPTCLESYYISAPHS